MRAKDLRDLTVDELDRRLADQRKELFQLRFQTATGQLENISQLRHTRREIARILTLQHEKRNES